MNKTIEANKLFDEGFNCCQAVFTPFAVEHGLSKNDSLKIASGFGAGMSYQGETCGAVVGAYMVIGLFEGYQNPDDMDSKDLTKALIKQCRDKFTSKNGSCQCKELLGANTGNDKDLKYLRENGIFKQKCPGYVTDSVEILQGILV